MTDLQQGDCLQLMQNIPDGSVDAIITDPPYTDGEKNVLSGHKIQTVLDVQKITDECFRVLKDDSFFVFFGLMPSIITWYNAAIASGFVFANEIIWAKMNGSMFGGAVKRLHENIFVFKKGNPKYCKTDGKYEKVNQELAAHGLYNVDSIFRTLSFLKSKLAGKNPVDKVFGMQKRNDAIYQINTDKERILPILNKETKNFTTVWAFLPHNKEFRNSENGQIKHPTVKSLQVMNRLIELCTPGDDETILDPFMGSGSTGIAAVNLNRNFVGMELDPEYFQIAEKRIKKAENTVIQTVINC